MVTLCAIASPLLALPTMATLGDVRPLATRAAGTIHCLPDDVLLLIISFVDVRDILSLRKVSALPWWPRENDIDCSNHRHRSACIP